MSLRPRYSLLTLLLLTALIAGGVKLWYGPHHVVESVANGELEYSYTRDWRGNRIVQGPRISRSYNQGQLVSLQLTYYRQGQDSGWIYNGMINHASCYAYYVDSPDKDCPLSAPELADFRQARDAELQKILAAGMTCTSSKEGIDPFHFNQRRSR